MLWGTCEAEHIHTHLLTRLRSLRVPHDVSSSLQIAKIQSLALGPWAWPLGTWAWPWASGPGPGLLGHMALGSHKSLGPTSLWVPRAHGPHKIYHYYINILTVK